MRNLKFIITQVEMAKSAILNYLHGYKHKNPLLVIKETEASIELAVNMIRNMIQVPNSIW